MIPKVIYQTWFTRDVHPKVAKVIKRMKKRNPSYEHKIFTDDELHAFVEDNFDKEIVTAFNKLNIIVAKVDFWRYLILYKLGGIYLDMDSTIKQPLDLLIKEEDKAIITAEKNDTFFVQWALIFSAKHPILEKTIELILENIKTNKYPNDIHQMTGPTVFSRAIQSVHKEYFNEELVHSDIDKKTDKTYAKESLSYRIYGIDYNKYFKFYFRNAKYLYKNKIHWKQEQQDKTILI